MPVRNYRCVGLLAIGIIALSVTLQSLLLLNWDVASLLHAARVMMSGGVYATDMFIPNPPTILYLFVPPLMISDALQINIVLVFKAYIYLMAALSTYLCYRLAKPYFNSCERDDTVLFMLTLLFAFLVLPTYEFGNRDYLLLVFIMPYLLMVAARIRGMKINPSEAIVVGLFAGIGFAIKPHFMAVLAFVELYYLASQRKWLANLRPETVAIAGVIAAYIVILFTVHPNYVYVILPFLLNNYYSAISISLYSITIYPLTVFCFMAIAFSVLIRPYQKQQPLFNVLIVALLGLMLSIYLQHTLFYYHFLPAISLALLLTVMQLANITESSKNPNNDLLKLMLLAAVFIGCDVHYYYNDWRYLIFTPAYFYAVFALIFAFVLSLKHNRWLAVSSRVMFIVLAGLLCSTLLLDTDHYTHRFLLVVCLMSLSTVLLTAQTAQQLIKQALIIAVTIAMFYVPSMLEYDLYIAPREYKLGALNKLAAFIDSRGGKQSIYVFSSAIYYTYPLVFYANAVPAQRFEQLWPVMGFANPPKFANELQAQTYRKNKDYFISMVAQDFLKNKPDLVFIDNAHPGKANFDYVRFFSANPSFVQAWKSYRYLTTLHLGYVNNVDTSLPVYERIS